MSVYELYKELEKLVAEGYGNKDVYTNDDLKVNDIQYNGHEVELLTINTY